MNIALWVLQILLALHTAMGAVWKLSHSAEQTMPSLKAIPSGAWLSLALLEFVCAVALVFPALYRPLAIAIPIAATCIAAEMLLFTGLHLASSSGERGPIAYWLVVAALSGLLAYCRFALKPL